MWRLASLKLSTSNLVLGKSMPASQVPGLGCTCPLPCPRHQAGDWKRDPRCFSTDSPILLERTEAGLRDPSPEGKACLSGGMDRVATICTWLMRGRWLREPFQLPRGPGSLGPARLGRKERFWPFLPILYHYYCRFLKNPINTHFKWNLKLLLCERTL